MKINLNQQHIKNVVEQLSKEMQSEHSHIVQSTVIPEAQNYAAHNLPAATETSIEPFLITIRSRYDSLKKGVSLNLKGGLQRFLGSFNNSILKKKIEELKEAIKNELAVIKNLSMDKNRLSPTGNLAMYKRQEWLILLFAIAEALLNVSCFLELRDMLFIALITGSVVGFAQVFAAKQAILFIREITNPAKRKFYFRIALIAFTLFSFLLGLLRYYFVSANNKDIPFLFFNPLLFTAVSMVLIIATGLLTYLYYPRKKELQILAQLQSIDAEIIKHHKAIKKMEDEISQLEKAQVEAVALHSEIIHDEQKLHEMIDADYAASVGEFIRENLTKRPDHQFPFCFKNRHIPLGGSNFELQTPSN